MLYEVRHKVIVEITRRIEAKTAVEAKLISEEMGDWGGGGSDTSVVTKRKAKRIS